MMRYTRFAPWHHEVISRLDWRRDRDWYSERLSGVKGSILELACGDGRLMRPLLEAGKEVWGLDASKELLEIADKDLSSIPDARLRTLSIYSISSPR